MAENRPAKPPPVSKPVFRAKPGAEVYRIPSLIYIKDKQRLIAFAEERSSPSDDDAKILVMKEGKFLADRSIEWLELQKVTTAKLDGHRTMNPCPVYEKNSRTLFLFFICIPTKMSEQHQIRQGKNAARLCCVSKKDGEEKWSDLRDVTASVIGDEVKKWATFAVGPGHGVQLASGRLIVPAYTYYIKSESQQPARPHAFYFYSDDRGSTWHISQLVEEESCECEMAEVMDGESKSHLYCNARNISKDRRVEARGVGEGNLFHKFYLASELVEQPFGCQGSVVSFPVPDTHREEAKAHGTLSWLLFSHPSKQGSRRDLGVYLNKHPFHQSHWERPWIVNLGPSGYSDLAYCEDSGRFACLVERGEKVETEEIASVCFSLADVLEGVGSKV